MASSPVLRDITVDHPNVTVVEGDATALDWTALLARPRRLGARRQPAVQRRHAARARPARRGSGDHADAGDGAARGRRAFRVATRLEAVRRGRREGRVLGRRLASSATCRRRCSCRGPTSSRRSWRSHGTRHRPPTQVRCSHSCVRRSGSAARCCDDRWPVTSLPSSSSGRRLARRSGPKNSASTTGAVSPTSSDRSRERAGAHRRHEPIRLRAPAKLTLNAPDHRRARRRLPPDRRRDGQPRPARRARDDRRRSGRASTRRAVRRRGAARRHEPRRARARSRRARRPRHDRQADPPRRRTRRRLDRRGRRAPLGAARPTRRLARRARLGADVSFCLVGGRARVRGIGEIVEPLPPRRPDVTLVIPPLRGQHAGRLSGVGRTRRTDRRRAERPRTGRDRRRARTAQVARPRSASATGRDTDAGRERRDLVRATANTHNALADLVDEGVVVIGAHARPTPSGRPIDADGRERRSSRTCDCVSYLRRWWRVRRSIFLCFFFRMRLRRFLTSEPIRLATLSAEPATTARSARFVMLGATSSPLP